MPRRWLPWLVLSAAALHAAGMVREPLPAQDGLKFIKVARRFHAEPWTDVVRGSDQHPLYPACIAVAQPLARTVLGPGPDSWRVAAQLVSVLASLAVMVPFARLARSLFDDGTAMLAALLLILLPLPHGLGHDTLSDALGLLAVISTLCLGEVSLRTRRVAPALACGLVAGLGYWARPEVVIAALAVFLSHVAAAVLRAGMAEGSGRDGRRYIGDPTPSAALAIGMLVMVGAYTLVKGEVSEKLAIRSGASLASRHDVRKAPHPLPSGLESLDFSPKEESGHRGRLDIAEAANRIARSWSEGLGWWLVPVVGLGAWMVRAGGGRGLVLTYGLLVVCILLRHATTLGYVSDRHVLGLVVVALPWAAAGLRRIGSRLSTRLDWVEATRGRLAAAAIGAMIVAGLSIQHAKPGHPTRWGHGAAGRWLAQHSGPGDAVLDTRGWAAFVSGRPSYDYWHVRQALTDANLAYVVVGADELAAPSRRAATLRAWLGHAARPVVSFPGRHGGTGADVLVFRYWRPASWEGVRS